MKKYTREDIAAAALLWRALSETTREIFVASFAQRINVAVACDDPTLTFPETLIEDNTP